MLAHDNNPEPVKLGNSRLFGRSELWRNWHIGFSVQISKTFKTTPTTTYKVAKLKEHLGQVLKLERITHFSKLKQVFAGCTSLSVHIFQPRFSSESLG